MEVKTIKGIGKEKWIEFKALAARKDVSLGNLFGIMLDDYLKRSDYVWGEVLKGEKILSDEEAKKLKNVVVEIRKERGFRIWV